jgi:hypothetical protein
LPKSIERNQKNTHLTILDPHFCSNHPKKPSQNTESKKTIIASIDVKPSITGMPTASKITMASRKSRPI